MTDLRRDLQRGDDIPLMRVRTTDPDPVVPPDLGAQPVLRERVELRRPATCRPTSSRSGAVPALQGVAGPWPAPRPSTTSAVTPSFESIWLPTQSPISRITADRGLALRPGDDGLPGRRRGPRHGRDISYSMTGVELDLSAESMARAPVDGRPGQQDYTELPDGIAAAWSSNLAFQVTRNERHPVREGRQALQEWFREDGGFTYDLDASPGNGADDLVAFLTEGEGGRTGYCEQFASAMAVMARVLGIPARVAVGFLPAPEDRAADLGVQRVGPARLAGALLPGIGLGPVRAHAAASGRRVPDYTTEQINLSGRVPAVRASHVKASCCPAAARAPAPPARTQPRRTTSGTGRAGSPGRRCWAPAAAYCSRSGCCSCRPWCDAPARAAGSAPDRRQPGPSCATPRPTCGVPWPFDRSPRETRDALVAQPRPAGAGRHPRTPACTAPTSRPLPSRHWTGSCSASSGCATPGPARRPTRAGSTRTSRPASRPCRAGPPARPAAGRTG